MLCCVFLAKNLFQSTLPRRERRGVCKKFANGTIFQSTLPRRERPDRPLTKWDRLVISIHAPTKGATWLSQKTPNGVMISIHAPTKGATMGICTPCSLILFQSTLPRRERLSLLLLTPPGLPISIHAPTKGATINQ